MKKGVRSSIDKNDLCEANFFAVSVMTEDKMDPTPPETGGGKIFGTVCPNFLTRDIRVATARFFDFKVSS
jgi:hypothetical protein